MELWEDIPSSEGRYQVSNHGRIKRQEYSRVNSNQVTSWEQGYETKILKPTKDSHGYFQACYFVEGQRVTALVHRLVAEAFLEPPSQGLIEECLKAGHKVVLVNHKDNNPLNNLVDNLEWCTPSYNNEYSPQDYSSRSGDNCKHAVLKESDVDKILELRGKISQKIIADMFNVKQITISNIFTGRSWSSYTNIPRKERNKGKRAAKTAARSEGKRNEDS